MADTSQTGQQNSQYLNQGGANDDSGKTTTYYENDGTSSNTDATPEVVITAQRPTKQEPPGKRLYNPLSKFSSYNYQLSLYMITPDAYEAFILSGRKNINALVQSDVNNRVQGSSGAYIVAQSGGLGTSLPRAPGMEFDYFIDNLRIKSAVSGKATTTSTNINELSFNIYEPYGFSFITKLTKASEQLTQTSKLKNMKELKNATRNFFILGIRFLGYDSEGKLLSSSDLADSVVTQQTGASYEFFYDIKLTKMKFKIDGKVTTYDITAVSLAPQTSFGASRGRIKTGVEISGQTVKDTLQNLVEKLNSQQEELSKTSSGEGNNGVSIKNVYKIEYLGDAGDIQEAVTVTEADKKDKLVWPMSEIAKTQQVNDGYSVKASPDNTKRTFSFAKSVTVMQAINSVISQSSFLADTLKVMQKSEIENMAGTDDNIPNPKPPKTLAWYNLSSSVKPLGFDPTVGDFAYEITYYIQMYEIPYITSPYADKVMKYYGPHKRYEYWYTGKNSEILSYEQTMDNAYFMAALIPTGSELSQGGSADQPTQPLEQQNADKTGRKNTGNEAKNSVVTSLHDPGAYANAKITVIGDPDFLIQDSPSSINQVYRQFYGDNGYTVNPNGGQVFIEIDFKEGVDYDNQTGTMTINESIQFWRYSPGVAARIKGVSYMVNVVESSFSGGKFTQVISATIATFPDGTKAETEIRENQNEIQRLLNRSNTRTSTNDTAPTPNSNQTNLGSGLKTDPAITTSNTSPDLAELWYPSGQTQLTSPTGGGHGLAETVAGGTSYALNSTSLYAVPTVKLSVANDDAVGQTSFFAQTKKLIQDNTGGRETENPDQSTRNLT